MYLLSFIKFIFTFKEDRKGLTTGKDIVYVSKSGVFTVS